MMVWEPLPTLLSVFYTPNAYLNLQLFYMFILIPETKKCLFYQIVGLDNKGHPFFLLMGNTASSTHHDKQPKWN